MPLPKLEQQLETILVKALAHVLALPEDHVEELIVVESMKRNLYLRGGMATAFLGRHEEESYVGCVWAVLPCETCQAHGHTFRLCHPLSRRVLQNIIPDIDPDIVPTEFHRNIGEKPIEIMTWNWDK